MRLYDLVIILKSSLPEAERKKAIETVKGWLKNIKIVKEDPWGQKPLAYPIEREISGVYHFFALESENGITQDLEKRILGNDQIIRHLLIRRK